MKGIDVSRHQGVIRWDEVKPHIDFAILRCGYGGNLTSQDDSQFARNAAECERLGIPYAVYLYSYATTEEMIDSEIAHTLRVVGNRNPFCVYIDMEDNSAVRLGKRALTAFAKRFCEAIKAKGFRVGVYANQNWFQNHLDVSELYNAKYSIWCAKYSENTPNIAAPYDIWQYTAKGKVDGISGFVDLNYMYTDLTAKPEKSIDELAEEVWDGKWGNGEERKRRLTAAGYDYAAIQKRVDALSVTTYTVKSGDTLSKIAKKHGTTYQKIAKDNGIDDPDVIHPGQKLKIYLKK